MHSRKVRLGHEAAFEAVLHRIADEASRFPGHLGVTILRPRPGGPPVCTMVAHFSDEAAIEAWTAHEARAVLIAEADTHASGELEVRRLSGLEGWLTHPGSTVVVAPPRWKIVLAAYLGIVPLLEAVAYWLAPHLTSLPIPLRPALTAAAMVPLMQYAVMPVVTTALRRFLYLAPEQRKG